ncbi:hypothetical protein [Actinoplanes subtropicus]|uniref:hypothetical protein n=1 Tax=Actinoplanes subtropicus TaxID=543632 RepID=UPI0004C2B452|nr:hypothetical protein [Actinoplanes subtropicus]
MAFTIVTPDGVMQGVHRRLLDQYGDMVVAYRVRTMTPELAERIYVDGLVTDVPGRHISSWWIKRKVFDLGESLGLLLRHPSDDGFQETFTAAKGRSDPLLAEPGTLRNAYRTPNKTFALLHSSDDLLSMVYEASVFFEPGRIEELFDRPAVSAAEVGALRSYAAPAEMSRIEQYRLLYRVKRRLLIEIAADRPGVVEHLLPVYDAADAVVAENPGFLAETDAIAGLLKEEAGILGATADPARFAPASALACLRLLADFAAYPQLPFAQFAAVLEALGVPLSALELTALESLFFFYRPTA